MRRQRRTKTETFRELILAVLIMALPLTGCAVLSPPTPRSGGDGLSDAAKETRKKPDQQATLAAGKRDRHERGDVDAVIAVDDDDRHDRRSDCHPPVDPEASRPARSFLPGLNGGLVAGGGTLRDGDFAPFTLYGVRVGIAPTRRARLDVAVLGGPSRFAPGSDVSVLLRKPWELAGDVSARYSLTPGHAAIGVAPIVGLRAGTLFWRYRNGIQLDRDGELRTVNDDWIDYVAPYAGVAVTVLRTAHVEIGAEALTGWRFYDDHTNAGLRNDLFGDTRFREFRITTTVPF